MQREQQLYLWYLALLTLGLAIGGLLLNLTIVGLGYDQVRISLPLLGEWSLLGVATSVPLISGGLSALPIWWVVVRFGPQWGLGFAALAYSGYLVMVAVSPSWPWFLAAVALAGPASVGLQASAAPLMMRLSSANDRDRLFSRSAGVGLTVAGIGNLLAGGLAGYVAPWFGFAAETPAAYRFAFAIGAVIVACALLPLGMLWSSLRSSPATNSSAPTAPSFGLPRNVRATWIPLLRNLVADLWQRYRQHLGLLWLAVPLLIISCGAALLMPYLNLYFRQEFGVPATLLGVIFAAINIGTGLATLLASRLSARFSKIGSVVLTQALAIPCLLLLGFAPFLAVAIGAAVVRAALMNMASPLYDAFAMEQTPEELRPLVIGMLQAAFTAAFIVAPPISVEIQLRYGFTPLFLITAVCYAIAVICTAGLFLRPSSPMMKGET